jgi:hypothetical protein
MHFLPAFLICLKFFYKVIYYGADGVHNILVDSLLQISSRLIVTSLPAYIWPKDHTCFPNLK